jgi:protein-S-isoprenylcysteine O-methyltransferase Ste14
MRSRTRAAVGSAAFFLVGPGIVAGVVPWWITGWRFEEPLPYWWIAQVLGVLLILAGLPVVIQAFVRFVVEGFGTPMPIAPPERLVVGGFYRYVRNPMYVSLLAIILGQTLLFGQLWLLLYLAFAWALPATFVRVYEEPKLTELFGEEYRTYKRSVPGWIPRLRPWHPESG